MFGQHSAPLAMTDPVGCIGKGVRHQPGAFTISFQQVECNTLRRFLSNAGHAAQSIDQLYE
jgi:hypothetical protein